MAKSSVVPFPSEHSAQSNPKKKRKKLPPNVVERDGHWWVRKRYRKYPKGPRHAVWRPCETKTPTAAKDALAKLTQELKDHGPVFVEHEHMTWLELSKYFRKEYVVPAQFVDGRVAFGYRSITAVEAALNPLDAYFGNQPIRTITNGDLRAFKLHRLATPVVKEKWQSDGKKKRGYKTKVERQRSISSVNKELRCARHVFNVAVDEGWMLKNPFKRKDRLISAADEKTCERIVEPEEEWALLAGCATDENDKRKDRTELRRRIILAIDSGMREGEMKKLQLSSLNFAARLITVVASHTKTQKARKVGMTNRVHDELALQCEGKAPTDNVFQKKSVKTAWTNLRNETGLTDIRWHDLRHTNATRIEKSRQVSRGQLQLHLGHADQRSTERYVNQSLDVILQIPQVLQNETARMELLAEEQVSQ